jgi:hypothetical protein
MKKITMIIALVLTMVSCTPPELKLDRPIKPEKMEIYSK